MTLIENLIAKNRPYFPEWERQLSEHFILQYEPESIEVGELERKGLEERIFFQTNGLLVDVAKNFFAYGKFKDEFDCSKSRMFPFGQHILLRSKKMDIAIDWGIEHSDFFLEVPLFCTENIRFMTDDFWQTLLHLKDLGEFNLVGGGGLNSEQKPYFENKTSTVFQIIRTFIINQHERMSSGDYGMQWEYPSLQIKWPADHDWGALVEKGAKTFKLLYNLNYQLWKISDLAAKKNETKKIS